MLYVNLSVDMRFLLVYDGSKAQENMKNFFLDVYDAFVKVVQGVGMGCTFMFL